MDTTQIEIPMSATSALNVINVCGTNRVHFTPEALAVRVLATGPQEVLDALQVPEGVDLTVKGRSCDTTIAVPRGIAVWHDIRAVAGSARSDLDNHGKPAEGEPHLTVKAVTTAGSIRLHH